jgi:hypothetical protein
MECILLYFCTNVKEGAVSIVKQPLLCFFIKIATYATIFFAFS